MFEGQKIIPAISTHQDLKKFLKLPLRYGILMNFQLAQLEELVLAMKEHKKKVLIHSELIRGLASDEYGSIYLIQALNVDGIISSKPKVIDVCKKRNVLGILRFFLKDTYSLKQSLMITQKVAPECLEVLPAVNIEVIQSIKHYVSSEVMFGGLINSEAQIRLCLNAGAIAITTSNPDFWNLTI